MLKNPTHPGEIIREETLPHFKMTISAAARVLHHDRASLHKVLQGQAALTPELALKIEKAFGVDAGLMLNVQANWELARARKRAERITDGIERQTVPA